MSKDKDDFAFPRPAVQDKMGWIGAQRGMTLRDYFAAKAMQGAWADPKCQATPERMAKWAYLVADAMLAERDK